MSHVFKCKMCGGILSVESNDTVCECEYCGAVQTLPRLDSDRKANLYDRANYLRRGNDFDRAMGVYEQILSEDKTDAEAYWSLVLCRYGIEYVEDPLTHKRIPTVNRAQYTSIFSDDDYLSALKYADDEQKKIYEAEAKTIDDIQRGILAISQKEEPFDIFICYKESDDSGRRTQDSLFAYEIYKQLTAEGYKVFFSRVTLEDKLGIAYEPYIFAALNSAKIMLVVGTRPEYFNAVWVKNEWSRYLALINKGAKKILIPIYRDMNPYDLPDEFSHLQAQDMSRIGFMQDLVRGINKILKDDKAKAAVKETVVVGGGASIPQLLERASMFLEDGSWDEADAICERILDLDPKNAQAYLGKLMAEQHAHKQADLKNCAQPFDTSPNYEKAVRFGDQSTVYALNEYIAHIKERNENDRLTAIYNDAVNAMNAANNEAAYKSAAEMFRSISGFKDADDLARQCLEKAGKAKKKRNKTIAIIVPLIIACIAIAVTYVTIIIPKQKLDKAMDLIAAGDYENAYALLEEIGNNDAIASSKYDRAVTLYDSGEYESAIVLLKEIGNYEGGAELLQRCREAKNHEALANAQIGDYVVFGTYEQDNDLSNGSEDIDWYVINRQGNRIFVVSRYALDSLPYNTSTVGVTWETCSLRQWLNNDFINTAFNAREQVMILTAAVPAEKNPSYRTPSGNSTYDRVFLLSISEATAVVNAGMPRNCGVTDYAMAQGIWTNSMVLENDKETGWWWLRCPGRDNIYAARMQPQGYTDSKAINVADAAVNDTHTGVRPAMWIDISGISN